MERLEVQNVGGRAHKCLRSTQIFISLHSATLIQQISNFVTNPVLEGKVEGKFASALNFIKAKEGRVCERGKRPVCATCKLCPNQCRIPAIREDLYGLISFPDQ